MFGMKHSGKKHLLAICVIGILSGNWSGQEGRGLRGEGGFSERIKVRNRHFSGLQQTLFE